MESIDPSSSDTSHDIINLSQSVEKMNGNEIRAADLWLVFFITFFGFATRVWALHMPDFPTDQERYYGNLLNHYNSQEFIIDSEPPLGVMLLSYFSKMQDYKSTIDFNVSSYKDKIYPSLRLIGGSFGGFLPIFAFLGLKILRVSSYAALTAALMLILETSLISEARLINIDGFFHFFCGLTFCLTCFAKGKPFMSCLWFIINILSGISLGLTISTKFSGVSLIPFIFSMAYISVRKEEKDILPFSSNNSQIYNESTFSLIKKSFLSTFIVLFSSLCVLYIIMVYYLENLPIESTYSNQLWPQIHSKFINKLNFIANDYNLSKRFEGETISVSIVKLFLHSLTKVTGLERNTKYKAKWFDIIIGFSPMYIMWSNPLKNVIFATHLNLFNCIFCLSSSVITIFSLLLISNFLDKKQKSRISKTIPFVSTYCFIVMRLVINRQSLFANDADLLLIFGSLTLATGVNFLMKNAKFKQGFILCLIQFASFLGFVLWCPWAYCLPSGPKEPLVWIKEWYIQ